MGNKKIRKKVIRIIPALEVLVQRYRDSVGLMEPEVCDAWHSVKEFLAEVKSATET